MIASQFKQVLPLVILAIFVSCLISPIPAFAQLIDVTQCVTIEDRLERADCYDSQVARQNIEIEVVDSLAPATPSALSDVVAPQAVEEPEPVNLQQEIRQIVLEPVPRPPAPPVPPSPPTLTEQLETFGSTPLSNTQILETEDGSDELHDRVASLRKRGVNRWLITLESGQVWYQTNSDLFRLRIGTDVIIYQSTFGGSFRLRRATQNGFIQVDRVE